MIDWVNDLIFWYKLRQLRHEDPFIYEIKEESREYKMTSCQNCGHESHCGTSLFKDHKDGDNQTINIKTFEKLKNC